MKAYYLCLRLQVGTTSGDVTFIDVPALKPNTPYNFRVTASNVVGSGPPYAPEEPITAGKMISECQPGIFFFLAGGWVVVGAWWWSWEGGGKFNAVLNKQLFIVTCLLKKYAL